MNNTELKPCPFCGGKVEIIAEEVDTKREVYMFFCENCGMSIYHSYMDGKESAIEAWNRRVSHE